MRPSMLLLHKQQTRMQRLFRLALLVHLLLRCLLRTQSRLDRLLMLLPKRARTLIPLLGRLYFHLLACWVWLRCFCFEDFSTDNYACYPYTVKLIDQCLAEQPILALPSVSKISCLGTVNPHRHLVHYTVCTPLCTTTALSCLVFEQHRVLFTTQTGLLQ